MVFATAGICQSTFIYPAIVTNNPNDPARSHKTGKNSTFKEPWHACHIIRPESGMLVTECCVSSLPFKRR